MKKIFLTIACISLMGCSSGLSRSKAKDIIQKNLPIQTYKLWLTTDAWKNVGVYAAFASYPQMTKHHIAELEKAGLIAFKPAGSNPWVGQLYNLYVTAEGEKYVVNRQTPYADVPSSSEVTVKFADLAISEITGIKMSEDNKKAEVSYTAHYTNLTPFGAGFDTSKNFNFSNELILFDDGWRFKK